MPHHGSVDAVLFDFDGVLVDSVAIKQDAFRQVIASRAGDKTDACMAYFMTQGGVSRIQKFDYVWTRLLGRPACPVEIESMASEFSERVFEETIAAPSIEGAREFLLRYQSAIDLFVISGTPETELREIVHRRQMESYFQGVFGSPRGKVEIGRQIVQERGYDPERVVFVGDATTDRDAARELGVRFIGLEGPHLSPYLDGSEEMLRDLTTLEETLGCACMLDGAPTNLLS